MAEVQDLNNPTEDVVVSQQEMTDLGEFLNQVRDLLLNHEARLGVAEKALYAIAEVAGLVQEEDEINSKSADQGDFAGSEGRVDDVGNDTSDTGNEPKPDIPGADAS